MTRRLFQQKNKSMNTANKANSMLFSTSPMSESKDPISEVTNG